MDSDDISQIIFGKSKPDVDDPDAPALLKKYCDSSRSSSPPRILSASITFGFTKLLSVALFITALFVFTQSANLIDVFIFFSNAALNAVMYGVILFISVFLILFASFYW